jgi:hypothetical protein
MTGPTGITGITGITGPVGPSFTLSQNTTITLTGTTALSAAVSFTLEANSNYAVSWFIRATTATNDGPTTAFVAATTSVATNLFFSDGTNNVIINSTGTKMSGGVSADRMSTNATTSVTFTLTGASTSVTTLGASRFIVNVTKL